MPKPGIFDAAAAAAGGNPTHQQAALGADVAMTTNATFYDGPSLSLPAGNWIVIATASFTHASLTGNFTARIWDGTTTYGEEEQNYPTTTQVITIPVIAYVSLGSTTTIKVSGTGSMNSATLKADPVHNSSAAHKSTQIIAILVA